MYERIFNIPGTSAYPSGKKIEQDRINKHCQRLIKTFEWQVHAGSVCTVIGDFTECYL